MKPHLRIAVFSNALFLLPGFFLPQKGCLQDVNEEGDDQAVQEICKKASDDWNEQKCLDGHDVLVAEGLHVGHGVRCGAHSEAADAGNDNCGVVVFSEDAEGHDVGIEDHEDGLCKQQDDHRQGQRGELPDLQCDHGDSQKQGEGDSAQVVDLTHADLDLAGVFSDVADHGSSDHGADVDWEGHSCL